MRRLLFIVPFMLLFAACGEENQVTDQFDKITWESEVKQYPMLACFPKYDGDLDQHMYYNSFGPEQYTLRDFEADEALYNAYVEKLKAAGFVDDDIDGDSATGSFEKRIEDESEKYSELTVIVSYHGNSFTAIYSAVVRGSSWDF